MLIDAEQLEDGARLTAPIAIIGGGLAGIALGRQLADAGLDVAIIESGGHTPDPRIQELYAGTMTVGSGGTFERFDEYLTASRIRAFGGSGHVWGGKCGALDPMDFEKRDWVEYSGWPLTRAAMHPYYDRASDLLAVPRFTAPLPSRAPESIFERQSTRFTPRGRAYTRYSGALPNSPFKDYTNAALQHPRITVYLHANVTRIALRADGRRVDALDIRTLTGRRHSMHADTCIVAIGGIENVRLLLASNDVVHDGIGNHSDWLGRGFQGHSTISPRPTTICLVRAMDTLSSYDNTRLDRPHTVVGTSDAAQRKGKHLNFTMTLAGKSDSAPSVSVAVADVAARLARSTTVSHMNVYFMTEHPPNRDSRISLASGDRDRLGMPRVRLDMRHQESELDSLEGSIAMLARELGRLGIGRVQWSGTRDDWKASMKSLSRHHMGATRMAASPSDGVVNEHGRVHGVDNLFIAGSSVFPTSGIMNPTLTLLALGFRMGDRLIARNGRDR